jgi:hypothetical protein
MIGHGQYAADGGATITDVLGVLNGSSTVKECN